MLPIPTIDYMPEIFKGDSKAVAFCEMLDGFLEEIKTGIIGLNDISDPVRMPVIVLDRMGNYLNAGIYPGDSEDVKRKKIATAVKRHKYRGSFKFDVKGRIDNIAGGDSKLVDNTGGPDWIIIGKEEAPPGSKTAVWSGPTEDNAGINIFGTGYEFGMPGVVRIDVDNPALTVEQQEKIRIEMLDTVPAYYYVVFGYFDGDDFVEYFSIG